MGQFETPVRLEPYHVGTAPGPFHAAFVDENGDPVDATGADAYVWVWVHLESDTADQLNGDAGDAGSNTIKLTFDAAAQTALLTTPGTYLLRGIAQRASAGDLVTDLFEIPVFETTPAPT